MSYWADASNAGKREYARTAGNVFETAELTEEFYFKFTNNLGDTVVEKREFSYTLSDNLLRSDAHPDGIYFDYGITVSGGRATLPTAYEYGCESINATAEYRFDNGDTKTLAYATEAGEDKFSVMIKYNGEADFSQYDTGFYDYTLDNLGKPIHKYYANGTRYLFDPTKASAEICAVVWQKERVDDGIYGYKAKEIEQSRVELELTKSAPTSISVQKLNAKVRAVGADKMPMAQCKDEVCAVTNGETSVKLCCDIDGDGNLAEEQERQYFTLDVVIGGNPTMRDYEVTITNPEDKQVTAMFSYTDVATGELKRFYVAKNVGRCTVKVKSAFCDAQCEFTVNVVDPVVNERVYDNVICPEFYSVVDFSPYLRIEVIKLSWNSGAAPILRGLSDGENLKYYYLNVAREPSFFTYTDMPRDGYDITVVWVKNGVEQSFCRYYAKNIAIIPDFGFKVGGLAEYRFKDITGMCVYNSMNNAELSYGSIPLLEVTVEIPQNNRFLLFEVTDAGELEGDVGGTGAIGARYMSASDKTGTTIISVYYQLQYKGARQPKAEIMRILLIAPEA